jgi:hypothetical protein
VTCSDDEDDESAAVAAALSKLAIDRSEDDGSRSSDKVMSIAGKQDGSAKHPFVRYVDPAQLGRSHPFFVIRIENQVTLTQLSLVALTLSFAQVVDKTTRNVWELILMAEHPGEVDRYVARVVGPNSLMVTMPSIPAWLLDEAKVSTSKTCATTKMQYRAAIAEYQKNGRLHSINFLIHFPSDAVLDNAVFGRDGKLKKEVILLDDTLEGRNGKDFSVFATAVRWKIAEQGLRSLEADEPATNIGDLFVAKYG